MKLYYEYLGPTILAGFDTYKYSSKDTSPLSEYVMHPFWNQVSPIYNFSFTQCVVYCGSFDCLFGWTNHVNIIFISPPPLLPKLQNQKEL
jgi:hypothetical protein